MRRPSTKETTQIIRNISARSGGLTDIQGGELTKLSLRATGTELERQVSLFRDIYPDYKRSRHLLFIIRYNRLEADRVKTRGKV